MKKYSIIIPVHNNLNYTKNCIFEIFASMQNHDFDPAHIPIVIIDDGSEDGTSDYITKKYPFIHLIKGDGNLWWSGAINLGVKYSVDHLKMDYVLLWNNDITPSPNYFHQAIQIINSNEKLPIICSMVFYKNRPDRLISTGNFFNRKTGKFGLNNYGVIESEVNIENQQINWVEGHGVLIRTDIFNSIGYFDEKNFPQYHGDSDFGLRASLAGYKIHFDRNLKIWNDTSRTGTHSKKGGLKDFIDSLASIRSNYNLKKDIKFYSKYATSKFAYLSLIRKYVIYFLSFMKRKISTLLKIS